MTIFSACTVSKKASDSAMPSSSGYLRAALMRSSARSRQLLHDRRLTQRGNCIRIITELRQDRAGVLPQSARPQGALSALAVDQHRPTNLGVLALRGMLPMVECAQVAPIRILYHLRV